MKFSFARDHEGQVLGITSMAAARHRSHARVVFGDSNQQIVLFPLWRGNDTIRTRIIRRCFASLSVEALRRADSRGFLATDTVTSNVHSEASENPLCLLE